MSNENKKSKNPLVRETQKLHEIELEAFEHLGKDIEDLNKRTSILEKKVAKLEGGQQ